MNPIKTVYQQATDYTPEVSIVNSVCTFIDKQEKKNFKNSLTLLFAIWMVMVEWKINEVLGELHLSVADKAHKNPTSHMRWRLPLLHLLS